jgi:glycosyltransferase involved in cell wall biosynthesis
LRPSIVHTHNFRSDVVSGGVARRSGHPTVTTVHGFTGGDWKLRLYERYQRRVFRRFSAVVAVSRPLGAELLADGVPQERLHVVPNAYGEGGGRLVRTAARQQLGVPAEAVRIGWVGRLSKEKGPDTAVRALAELGDSSVSLSFIGDGPERPRLEALAARLGVADRITWHGVVPDAGKLAAAFDLFLLTSRTEGTPMVLFEAMAAEVPIVATRVGGVPDVVGDAALLVPADDASAVAGALLRTRSDRDGAMRRAAAARERLARVFALDPWLDRYDQVYERAQVIARAEQRS